jgi:phospholipid/cholesterol/gamma-HCH transport system substrate-binding protein
MSHRLAQSAAMAVASALLVTACDFSVYNVPLPGGADVGDNSYTVTVEFRNVLDLVPQSAVKVDDVTVGRVESVDLDGWTAEVVVRLRGDVKLPDNALAGIRQTSLLGEKFVSLSQPAEQSRGRLGDGDVIPLSRSGRNPEVEEVLGAMSLLLNGGGVAQMKTISTEFANVLDGNEKSVKSLLSEFDEFMGQIDTHKRDIVRAIEALNRLSKSVKNQQLTIERALDRMPAALDSIDKQRKDLIKMLQALGELSDVGTQVIRESTGNTVRSLRSLAPVLTKLADAGEALPKSFNVFLTYPFVDAAIGRTPAEARNTHLGDYTNLDARLDIDLTEPFVVPGLPGADLPEVELPPLTGEDGALSLPNLPNSLRGQLDGTQRNGTQRDAPTPQAPGAAGPGGGQDGSGDTDDGCTHLVVKLCRTAPAFGEDGARHQPTPSVGYDPDIAAMLLQGVAR